MIPRTACRARSGARTPNGSGGSPTEYAPEPSASTAVCGTAPTLRSAATNSPVSAARWGSPDSRNTSRPSSSRPHSSRDTPAGSNPKPFPHQAFHSSEELDPMARFTGRTAIVTGAARGIGEVYAQALAAEGASVVVADLNAEGGTAVAEKIVADGGTASFHPVDVS